MEEVKSLKVQSTPHQCSSMKTLLVYKPGCPSPALPNACRKYKTRRVTQPLILFSFILSRTAREQPLWARCVAPLTFSEPGLQYTGYSQFKASGKTKKEEIWSGLASCIYQSLTEEHPEKHTQFCCCSELCSVLPITLWRSVPHAGGWDRRKTHRKSGEETGHIWKMSFFPLRSCLSSNLFSQALDFAYKVFYSRF